MEQLPVNPILKWVSNRIKKNKNVIISVNGATGTAKTYSAIMLGKRFSDELGTHFSIKDNLDFNFKDLLKKMQIPENQKPGTPFIFEEVGSFESGASARAWQSAANKFFFSFMQTSRHRNQILIFTCPHFSFLERGARSLVHLQMETSGIDFKRRVAFLKPYRIQVNNRTGQFYFKYLRVSYKGRRFKFKRLEVPHPPQDMADEYEIVKSKFTSKLNQSIIEQEEKSDGPKTIKNQAMMDKLLQNQVKNELTNREIASLTGFSTRTVGRRKEGDKFVQILP